MPYLVTAGGEPSQMSEVTSLGSGVRSQTISVGVKTPESGLRTSTRISVVFNHHRLLPRSKHRRAA
jgi:hypothetical protein